MIQICLLRTPRIRLHLPSIAFTEVTAAYVQRPGVKIHAARLHYTILLAVPCNDTAAIDWEEVLDL